MGKHTKYGYCPLIKKWVPRDDMRAVNVKAFDEDNREERVRIRVSPIGHEMLLKYLRSIAWTGVLREEQEVFPELSDKDRETLRKNAASTQDYERATADIAIG